MATATRGNPVGPTIDDFLVKLAADKSAEANTEPGSIGGPTAHPVKNVEDHTQNATEGERSSENCADVKKDQGSPGVDSTPEAKAASFLARAARLKRSGDGPAAVSGSAADDQIQVGTNKQPTGDDPSVETGSAKGGKTDPGSAHPARTDNDQLDGGKYAFDANASFDDLSALVIKCGEDLCAILSAVPQAQAASQNGQAKAATDADPRLAGQAGWELAGLLTGQADKQAVDALVVQTVAQIMKSGEDKASRVSAMLTSFKAAEEEGAMPPEDPAGGGGDAGGMGAASEGEGAGGGGDEAAMMAAMGGGAGGGGGEGGDEAELEQLLSLLEAKGIDPGELLAALQAEGGGAGGAGGGMPPGGGGGMPPDGGGGMPPGGGGGMPPMSPAGGGGGGGAGMPPGGMMPPGGGGGLPPGMDVAASDRRATKQSTDRMREVLQEIVARSRR